MTMLPGETFLILKLSLSNAEACCRSLSSRLVVFRISVIETQTNQLGGTLGVQLGSSGASYWIDESCIENGSPLASTHPSTLLNTRLLRMCVAYCWAQTLGV
jgi:hypothetical protein